MSERRKAPMESHGAWALSTVPAHHKASARGTGPTSGATTCLPPNQAMRATWLMLMPASTGQQIDSPFGFGERCGALHMQRAWPRMVSVRLTPSCRPCSRCLPSGERGRG